VRDNKEKGGKIGRKEREGFASGCLLKGRSISKKGLPREDTQKVCKLKTGKGSNQGEKLGKGKQRGSSDYRGHGAASMT